MDVVSIDDKEPYCYLMDDSLLFNINDSKSKHIYFLTDNPLIVFIVIPISCYTIILYR